MTTIPKQAAKSETQIKSIFLELEKYRLKMFKKFSIYCTVLITLLITFWTLGYINNKENSDILIWTITIIVAGWYFFCKDPLKEYRRYYKKRIIPIVLKPYGGKFYSEFGFFPVDDLKKFYITPWFDDNDLEDSFEYKVEDVKAQFSEIKLYNRYGGYSRNTYYRTKFKGAGIFIEMPFEFKSNIIVKKSWGNILNTLDTLTTGKQLIKLENSEFSKLFQAYSKDQEDARYILTPLFQERVVELYNLLKKSSRASNIVFEIKGNKVLFLIRSKKDLLEPASIFTSAYNTNKLKDVIKEIEITSGIIKQLKLDYLAARKTAYKKLNNSIKK